MRAICVDDEPLVLTLAVAKCRKLGFFDEVLGFQSSREALDYLKGHRVDVALIDVDMPEVNGLEMAKIIQRDYPATEIIFQTGFQDFAVDAFAMHVSGYLLKPISQEKLAREVEYALSKRREPETPHIEIRTFGNFSVLVDGRPIRFERTKAKELLAYLVRQRGSVVSRMDAFYTLWEDGNYDRPMQKQMDVVIRSLRDTLQNNGISEIMEIDRGLRVRPETFQCDYYRFLDGDSDAIRQFHGEFMSSYSWAEETAAGLTMAKQERSES